jgi:hypothetical protein
VAEVKENVFCPEGHSDEITKYLPVGMKLYTHPPVQPSPLTEDQIEDIEHNVSRFRIHKDDAIAFTRAIEQAIRSKA